LFVTGVMNILWIAIIAAFVLLERVAPAIAISLVSRVAGVVLFSWGAWLAIMALR